MHIVFIIDTSASMNQLVGPIAGAGSYGGNSASGLSLLDSCKNAVEHFCKIRSRVDRKETERDRYFLFTTESGSSAIKVFGWKENFSAFQAHLKNLTATSLTNFPNALQKCFDTLNLYRVQSGTDNYGQGRLPWYVEPTTFIVLSDGGELTSLEGVFDELNIPTNSSPGSELTIEPFRWDQRMVLFSLQYSFWTQSQLSSFEKESTHYPTKKEPPLAPLCETMGGTHHVVRTNKELMGHMETLALRLPTSIVVNFEPYDIKHSDAPPPALHKMIHIRANTGFWPIPESYYLDASTSALNPRHAQPTFKVGPPESDPFIVTNFPFDKYEIENCHLVQWMLTRKQGLCSQVFVEGSSKTGSWEPFGFLKSSVQSNSVSLFVLPFNYPKLWPMLEELSTVHKMNPTPKWKHDFETKYIHHTPIYYLQWLRNAFRKWGAPASLIPESVDSSLSYSIDLQMKKLKQAAKQYVEKTQNTIKVQHDAIIQENPAFRALLSKKTDEPKSEIFDIESRNLTKVISKMRTFLRNPNAVQDEQRYSMPISQMGNFQEVLGQRQTLRALDEEKSKKYRPIFFGNPFRMDKSGNSQRFDFAVDEASIEEGTEELTNRRQSPHLNRRRQSPPSSPRNGTSQKALKTLKVESEDPGLPRTTFLAAQANSQFSRKSHLRSLVRRTSKSNSGRAAKNNHDELFHELQVSQFDPNQGVMLQFLAEEARRLKKFSLAAQLLNFKIN